MGWVVGRIGLKKRNQESAGIRNQVRNRMNIANIFETEDSGFRFQFQRKLRFLNLILGAVSGDETVGVLEERIRLPGF